MECKIPNLFKLLKDRGITQSQLSRATGISTGNIGDWKSGKSKPSADKLQILAEYFGVSTDYLLGTEKRKRPPFRLDLFGSPDESENIELLHQINDRVKDNPTNADDEIDTLILEIYKRLPEKKRKEALLTLLDLLKK